MNALQQTSRQQPGLETIDAGRLRLVGDWTVDESAGLEQLLGKGLETRPERDWDASGIQTMDTVGAWLLHRSLRRLEMRGIPIHLSAVRPEIAELLELVTEAEAKTSTAPAHPASGIVALLSHQGRHSLLEVRESLAFVGQTAVTLGRTVLNPTRLRARAVLAHLESGGVGALPIVGLLCFLMGVVIAYQAAESLREYGVNLYIVDLSGVAILREISPILTAIIITGRSGAAFAARIGTMKVTEELDALETLGLSPFEVLVLPMVLALVIAAPLLTVYADVAGVLGAMLMADTQLQVGPLAFIDRFQANVAVHHLVAGVVKAPFFALAIAMIGCLEGFLVSGGAEGLGRRTTTSVVYGIFAIILLDALFAVLYNRLGV